MTVPHHGGLLALLLPLLALAAGCVSPEPEDSAESQRADVVVAGTLHRVGDGYGANVTARNVGTRTLGWSAYHCVAPPGWTARLLAPNGTELEYRFGDMWMGCPSVGGALRPGEIADWTWGAYDPCNIESACDNLWDGRVGGCDGCSPRQEPESPPPGTYTWRFTFRYSLTPGPDLGGGQYGMPGPPYQEEHVDFRIEIPTA